MYRYVCSQCGWPWFSAAKLEDLRVKECEYCGGKLKAPEKPKEAPDFDFSSDTTEPEGNNE